MFAYRFLVIDDNQQIRDLLKIKLSKSGYVVFEAENGRQGYDLLLREEIHFIITDWMMPDLTGVQLCRLIRENYHDHYIYIILITARSAMEDLTEGLSAGADDFIAKPFHLSELQARINSGIRILELERKMLVHQRKLDEAYQQIQVDLKHAARLQRSLLPQPCDLPGKFKMDALFLPSRVLAGDIFNILALDDNHSLVYLLDVAGKGVPAALLSFTIAKMLNSLHSNALVSLGVSLASPAEAVSELNRIFQYKGNLHELQYFTLIYAVINHEDRELRMVQAGHPPPIHMAIDNLPAFVAGGGTPVGLWSPEKVKIRETVLRFQAGDRLVLYSDGVSETFNQSREPFSEERLLETLADCRHLSLEATLEQVRTTLLRWSGKDEFDDDVTLCALEFY